MATTLSFQTLPNGQHMMWIHWEKNGQQGDDEFLLYRERPEIVVHDSSKTYRAANGRMFQIGVAMVCKNPCFVAWPVD